MSDYNLGTASGTIKIKYEGDGAQKAKAGLGDVEKSSAKAGQAVHKVGTTAALAGGVIAAGLFVAVKAATNFEHGLSAIKAVSGATAAEMEKVRAKALQIGKDTTFSATDAASAMEELAKAGVSTTDILNGAADATVALAAAGEVSLPEAATIASNAMNQFTLSAKDLPHVADLIAGAANASAIDVKQFGYSLSQAGAVAHLAGLSFGDTTVAIAELGNAGIVGSDAGTSLKTMLLQLSPATKSARDEFRELGLYGFSSSKAIEYLTAHGVKPAVGSQKALQLQLRGLVAAMNGTSETSAKTNSQYEKLVGSTTIASNAFYDQNGKLKSLRDIQLILNNALKGYTSEQKQAALRTIFGSDAIRAASVLTGNGAAGYDKLAAAINKTKAADVAKTRMDNLNGSIEQLKGSAETLEIQLGTLLIPTIRSIVDTVNSLVGGFLTLSPTMQKVIVYFATATAGLLLFGAATIKIVTFVKEFSAALRVIAGLKAIAPVLSALRSGFFLVTGAVRAFTLALITNPVFLVIAALVLLAIGLVILYKRSQTFRDIVNGTWASIKAAVGAVVSWFTGTVVPFMIGVWNAIVTGLTAAKDAVIAVFNVIKSIVVAFLSAVNAVWSAYWGVFGGLITAVFNLVVAIIRLALAIMVALFELELNIILAVVRTVFNAMHAVISAVMNAIKAVVTTVWNACVGPVSAAVNKISSVVSSVFNAIRSRVASVLGAIRSAISSAWNAAASVTSSVWGRISNIVGSKINAVLSVVRGIGGRVKSALSGAGSWLFHAGAAIIQGLINGITSRINSLTQKLKELTNLIPKLKGPPKRDAELLTENGQLIMESLINGIASQVGPLRSLLQGVTNDIPSSFVATAQIQNEGRAAGRIAATTIPSQGGAPAVEFNVYNPIAEATSISTTKTMTRAAQLGVLG